MIAGSISTRHCVCCGATIPKARILWRFTNFDGTPTDRCDRHVSRNPCAIEGCRRATKANGGYGDDQWLCSEHWRIGCPPKSTMRRAYHRFFRIAKKRGEWLPEETARFWRFWNALVRRARARCAGDLDQSEIDQMFGWSE